MSKIFLGLFIFYFISGQIESARAENAPSKICYVCDGYVFCDLDNSTLPNCKQGSLCTNDQLKGCEDLFSESQNRICERPGIFPNKESPANFYKCLFSPNSIKFIEEKIDCPENKMFDSQALLCLTEEERKIAERLKEYYAVRYREYPEFSCPAPGTYSCPQDCKKYYYCDRRHNSEIFECPFGTYYSQEEKMCTEKLIPSCKNQLNKIANIERLRTLRLFAKIKKLSKNNVPPGLCMKFCEDNWEIITERRPETFKDRGQVASNGTYEISLELLDKYDKTASNLNSMIEKISKEEEEDAEGRTENAEEEYKEQNYNIQHRPKRLKGFFLRLVIKALWDLIRNVSSFLRQYIRQNVCQYVQYVNPDQTITSMLTTESSSATNPQNYTSPSTTSTHSDPITQEFNSSTSSPYSDSTETTRSYTSTFSFLSDSTTPVDFSSETSSAYPESTTETVSEETASSEYSESTAHDVSSDSTTSDSSTENVQPNSSTDSTTESRENGLNISPFCFNVDPESSDPSEEFESKSDGAKPPGENTIEKSPVSDRVKPDSSQIMDSDEDKEIRLPASSQQTHPTTNSIEYYPDSDKPVSHEEGLQSFKCPRVGVFRDPDNCRRYYRCIRARVASKSKRRIRYILIGKHYTCKNGKYFSPDLWECVTEKPSICP